ncbi:TetR family transcriptional regulator [Cryobacterium sp.]|jgi:AcrR family transcriptional regulator|uniref:TetR family transcriptional regulator n=1 Tax=Cryobacterium sp. TaxID=1926290 RepID=UPI00261FD90C|nr:TetR family transcriptional regulator [Cryobacterium sp.]MCU1445853.1 TetR family transcriptional regulator [Cryobacterium sp.]
MDTADLPTGAPPKDLEPTRQRILEAARAEFAAFGLAGARIDRIARNASASKERLYTYYRKKEELFSAVLELNLTEFAAAVAHQGADLAEFAGILYDHSVAHPEHLRIIDWARLERQEASDPPNALVDTFHAEQVRGILSLQAAGSVDRAWAADHLSALVFGIVSCWVHEPASAFSPQPASGGAVIAARRASVVRAVRRLIEPAAG